MAVLLIYEIAQVIARRRNPAAMARTAHAELREEWFNAISRQPGSEILAVQTLRNSVMSASMIASTAVLALMGTITLTVPSLWATTETAGGVHSALALALAAAAGGHGQAPVKKKPAAAWQGRLFRERLRDQSAASAMRLRFNTERT